MAGTTGSRPDRREAHDARRARRATVTDPAVVMEAAARFLAARSRSVAETRRRLLQLGYGAPVTDEVLDRLGRLGYLDDRAFAQAWIESRDRARPRGESALRDELRRKGLDDGVIRAALDERASGPGGPGWAGQGTASDVATMDEVAPGRRSVDRDAAHRLLERRSASLAREADPRKRRQKAYALLARNGFDPGTCREVSMRVVGTVAPDGPTDADVA